MLLRISHSTMFHQLNKFRMKKKQTTLPKSYNCLKLDQTLSGHWEVIMLCGSFQTGVRWRDGASVSLTENADMKALKWENNALEAHCVRVDLGGIYRVRGIEEAGVEPDVGCLQTNGYDGEGVTWSSLSVEGT